MADFCDISIQKGFDARTMTFGKIGVVSKDAAVELLNMKVYADKVKDSDHYTVTVRDPETKGLLHAHYNPETQSVCVRPYMDISVTNPTKAGYSYSLPTPQRAVDGLCDVPKDYLKNGTVFNVADQDVRISFLYMDDRFDTLCYCDKDESGQWRISDLPPDLQNHLDRANDVLEMRRSLEVGSYHFVVSESVFENEGQSQSFESCLEEIESGEISTDAGDSNVVSALLNGERVEIRDSNDAVVATCEIAATDVAIDVRVDDICVYSVPLPTREDLERVWDARNPENQTPSLGDNSISNRDIKGDDGLDDR